MHVVLSVIHIALWVFIALMWIRFVVDWVQIFVRSWTPTGILLVVLEIVYSTTDPPIKALRKVIPPLRLGQIAIDLSFIIVMMELFGRGLPTEYVLNACGVVGSASNQMDEPLQTEFGGKTYFGETKPAPRGVGGYL